MRIFVRVASAAVLIGAATLSARAAPVDDACKAKAGSTYDIMDCQKADLARAEAALNAAYAKAMAALPADQKAKLLEAERRWVAFREADCGVYYGAETGTIAGIEGGACMIQHAKDRIRDLATFSEP